MNQRSPFETPRSRDLFLFLWALVAVLVAIAYLPGPDRWQKPEEAKVLALELGPEMERLFVKEATVTADKKGFVVKLKLRADYRATIPAEGRQFQVGFQLQRRNVVLQRGYVSLDLVNEAHGGDEFSLRLPAGPSAPDRIFLSLVP